METIYIARHGFRLNWVTSNWTSETGLPRDPPLAARGVDQAKELAAYFQSLPVDQRPTAIFSSPYYRCLQTSQPTSEALHLPIYVEHGLSEWYSPVVPGTGLHPRPGSTESLKTYFSTIDPAGWSSVWYPSRRGEDVDEVHVRTEGFLRDFIPQVNERFGQKHKCVLLVSHAATVIALAHVLAGDRTLPLRVGCCTLTEFRLEQGTWQAKRLADGSHLEGGSERDWGFQDIQIADGKVIEDPGEPVAEDEDGREGSQIQRSNL